MTRREGQPEECLEILSNYKKCPDPNIRYIRILAHLDLEQFKEALQLLEVSIQIPSSLKVFPVPEELVTIFSILLLLVAILSLNVFHVFRSWNILKRKSK